MKNHLPILKDKLERFAILTEAEWEILSKYLTIETYKKNAFYIKAGQICKTVSLVTKGAFKAYYIRNGETIANDFYNDGDFAVEVPSFMKQQPSDSFMIAEIDTSVISISYNDLQQFCDETSNGSRLIRKIYDHFYLRRVEQEILLRMLDAQTRLNHYLESVPKIFNTFNQKDIASYLKMSEETLSRLKKQI